MVMAETKAVINTRMYSCKVPIIFPHFNETLIFSTDFSKNISIRNFTSILSARAEWVHADGPTYWRAESRTFTMKLFQTLWTRCCVQSEKNETLQNADSRLKNM